LYLYLNEAYTAVFVTISDLILLVKSVNIRHREVTVYTNDEDKPPQGQGLNRPAIVTLDRVYPYNKQSREPIMSREALREMDYEATLRRKCTKMGANFMEYRPDTGSFVFKVTRL
jgi:nuclear pore complex protein Nup98-Nup96